MSSKRWILGDSDEVQQNDSDIEATKPLLPDNNIPIKTPFLRMMFFGSIISLPYILSGMSLSFSAIALPKMNVNIDEASWFGSLPSFGSLAGAIFIGLIVDKYGRRPSFLISIIFPIIGWTLLAIDGGITYAFVGQFLAGTTSGCIFIGQIYAAESIVVNHHHLRNSFCTWSVITVSLGVLLDFILGRIMPYRSVACVAAIIAVISFLGICIFIPESPFWLFHRGQISRAKHSEKRLSIYQPVLKHVEDDVNVIRPKKLNSSFEETWQSIKLGCQKLKRKEVYKPLIIMTTWLTFVIFSGATCISAYQVNILNDYPVSNSSLFDVKPNERVLTAYDMSIVSGVLVLVAVILTSLLVTYVGIKKMYFISSTGMTLAMVTLAFSMSLEEREQELQFWKMTHTVAVWSIIFFFSFGVATIPTSVVGEMFPHDAKGFAGVPSISFCGLGGVVLKLHIYLYNFFGYRLYFFYAFVNLLSAIFVNIFVPETVGKTSEEITDYYMQ